MLDYTSGVTTISSTATQVAVVPAANNGILVSNTGASSVFLGGAGVTSATGYPLAAAATVTVPTVGGYPHALYAITASGTSTVAFLAPVVP